MYKKSSIFFLFIFCLVACNHTLKNDPQASLQTTRLFSSIQMGLHLDLNAILKADMTDANITITPASKMQSELSSQWNLYPNKFRYFRSALADLSGLPNSTVRIEYNCFTFHDTYLPQYDLNKREVYAFFIKKLQEKGLRVIVLLDYMSFRSDGGKVLPLVYNSQQIDQFIAVALGNPANPSQQGLIDFFYANGARIFEIWNEPYWTWGVAPYDFARALYTIYKEKKRSDVIFISGGIESGRPQVKPGSIDGVNGMHLKVNSYMQDLLKAFTNNNWFVNGRLPFDAFGVHPYGWFGVDLKKHLDLVYNYNFKKFEGEEFPPLWVTEVGSNPGLKPEDAKAFDKIAKVDAHQKEQIDDLLQTLSDYCYRGKHLAGISFFTYRDYIAPGATDDRTYSFIHFNSKTMRSEPRPSFASLRSWILDRRHLNPTCR